MRVDMVRPVAWVVIVLPTERIQTKKNNLRIVKVVLSTERIVEVAPVAEVIPIDSDHVNLPVQATYEETFMQTFPMPRTKRQVKSGEKIAYCPRAANLLADVNEPEEIQMNGKKLQTANINH